MQVHCVYIPDVILTICRMSLLLLNNNIESALCLYAGCHSFYMPDVTFALKTIKLLCVYVSDIVLSMCRMLLLFKNTMRMHCVYIPDVILFICRMTLLLQKNRMKVIVSIFRMPFCLYAGCPFCLTNTLKVLCVYIPDALLSICRMSLLF